MNQIIRCLRAAGSEAANSAILVRAGAKRGRFNALN